MCAFTVPRPRDHRRQLFSLIRTSAIRCIGGVTDTRHASTNRITLKVSGCEWHLKKENVYETPQVEGAMHDPQQSTPSVTRIIPPQPTITPE